jgi:hypothetical protein
VPDEARSARRAAASVAAVLAITLVLLEAALRVFTRSGTLGGFPLCPIDAAAAIRAARDVDFSKTYLVFDAELGWVVGPLRRSLNGLYESTADGARRISAANDAEPGKPWFALSFGDSFTHGDDVPGDGTWQHAAAAKLGRAVADFGVPGYGVDQALLRYRRIAPRFPSDVVMIGLMADNIGRHLNRYRPFLSPEETVFFAKPRFTLEGDALRLVPQPFATLDGYFAPDVTTKLASLAVGDPAYEPAWYRRSPLDAFRTVRVARTVAAMRVARSPRWRALYDDPRAAYLTITIVRDFAKAIEADHRRAVVVFFPDRTFLEDALAGREILAAPLLRELVRHGIEVLDATPVLADFVRSGNPLAECFVPHYSAKMNARLGEWLADGLRGTSR